ncbi:unnamed protein product [Leptidea sinapis]|uniref:Uncharacterized protein n=1 Tax=Leptidea sinapis TaxID=189913 RepID=A0A5E4PX57_9NEOP|nr:unnamed protein product [Leptidea sinapis]
MRKKVVNGEKIGRKKKRLRELTGKYRDIAQLKGFWRRLKITAKKNVSQHKTDVKITAGGHHPPSPSEDDRLIVELCPTDFLIDLNQSKSDKNVVNEKNNEPGIENKYNNTTQNIESNEVHKDTQSIRDTENIIMEESSLKLRHKSKQLPGIKRKKKNSHMGMIVASNIDLKTRSREMMEEEHALKIKYRIKRKEGIRNKNS